MPFKSRKTKAKYKDFNKVKLKVGRPLPKGENETTTAFKSRSIHVKEQLSSSKPGTEPTTKRKLNLHDLLRQCRHHSASVRLEAVTGLRELLTAHPHVLHKHLSVIIDAASQLALDKDATVRQSLLRIFSLVLPLLTSKQLAPFFPILSSHLCCAMTHIYDDIRLDSLLLLDLCLDHHAALVTDGRSNLLPNFLEQISRQNQTGSGKSAAECSSRSLLINPGSQLSTHKWRVNVLTRLNKFLQAVVDKRTSASTNTSGSHSNEKTVLWERQGPTHATVLPHNAADMALGLGFRFRASSFGPPGGGAETFASLDQLKTFTQILVPLLMQCWVEVGPSQLNTGLPGNALGADAVAMLGRVLGVLKLLLQCVNHHGNDTKQRQHLMEWMKDSHERQFVQHLLSAFPYGVHEPAKRRHGVGKRTASQGSQVSPLTLNLSVCEVMSNLLDADSLRREQDGSAAWRGRVAQFVIEALRTERLGGEDLQSALRFVETLLSLLGLEPDLRDDLLDAVLTCYVTKHVASTDKLLLMQFYSSLLSSHDTLLSISSEPFQKWTESLPALLISQGSSAAVSDKVTQVKQTVMEAIKVIGVQNNERFLNSLQDSSESILDALLEGGISNVLKRTAVELLWTTPHVETGHLVCLVRHTFAQSLSLELVKYAIGVLVNRYLREAERPGGSGIEEEDLLSFLFTLLAGSTENELGAFSASALEHEVPVRGKSRVGTPARGQSHVVMGVEPKALQRWQHRLFVAEIAIGGVQQMQNSQQVWRMFGAFAKRFLVEHPVVPMHTAHCLLMSLDHVKRLDDSCCSVVAHCAHNVLVNCATVEEQLTLCSDARTACFQLLSDKQNLSSELWALFTKTIKADCAESCLDDAMVQCACISAWLDEPPQLYEAAQERYQHVRRILRLLQTQFGENVANQKSWLELEYKVSLLVPRTEQT